MTQSERYLVLVEKANQLPSGGIMGMFMSGRKEWALWKLEMIDELKEYQVEAFLRKWEEYFIFNGNVAKNYI